MSELVLLGNILPQSAPHFCKLVWPNPCLLCINTRELAQGKHRLEVYGCTKLIDCQAGVTPRVTTTIISYG